jgi:large subunit ribosomal protein L18
MDNSLKKRNRSRITRKFRVRNALKGSSERPRLSISKTNLHLYAQLIDDEKGITLGGIGTLSKSLNAAKKSKDTARQIGTQIAQIGKE